MPACLWSLLESRRWFCTGLPRKKNDSGRRRFLTAYAFFSLLRDVYALRESSLGAFVMVHCMASKIPRTSPLILTTVARWTRQVVTEHSTTLQRLRKNVVDTTKLIGWVNELINGETVAAGTIDTIISYTIINGVL